MILNIMILSVMTLCIMTLNIMTHFDENAAAYCRPWRRYYKSGGTEFGIATLMITTLSITTLEASL